MPEGCKEITVVVSIQPLPEVIGQLELEVQPVPKGQVLDVVMKLRPSHLSTSDSSLGTDSPIITGVALCDFGSEKSTIEPFPIPIQTP